MPLRLLIPCALFGLALLLRLPTLSLPVEGEAAVLASEVERVGTERGWVSPGTPPTLPLIGGVLVATGLDPTRALRFVDLLLGCLVAPLGFALARRLGAEQGAATWVGLALALHPFLAVNAGGVHPGPDALGLVLLLAALAALASPTPAARRLGVLLAMLLAVSHPAGPLYLLPLLTVYALNEPGPRWQVLLPVLGVVAIVAGPVAVLPGRGGAADLGTLLFAWLPLAGLGVLWLAVPRGVRTLLRSTAPEARRRGPLLLAWAAGAVFHVVFLVGPGLGRPVGFELDTASGGALLVPLIVLTGLVGLGAWAAQAARLGAGLRWTRRAVTAVAAAAAVYVVTGPLQIAVAPAHPAAAGRLTWMREAVARAADAAGDRGWIVLGVAEGEPATQASLADAHPARAIHRRAPLPETPAEDGLRVLLPFPASAYPADEPFGLVVPAPRREEAATFDPVTTFDGAGIFEQEPIARVGAYLVMRVRGTLATDGEREDE
ncbi:MAG: hypothetical protein QNJ98_04720 [Planctomycetota bacterium]|nr:hypothetical protein [Planctomycetota bacterium]